MKELVTANLDIWSAAVTAKTSGAGRSNGNKGAYGINKLRELILELAVRGKLVPQDPLNEPASELLKKIRQEKDKLIADGKIKKDKPLPSITDEEMPFELPVEWKWERLGSIGYTQTGSTPSKTSHESFGTEVPFIKPGDIYLDHVEYGNEGLSFYGAQQSGRIAPSGSLLMVCIGTIGKCNLIERDCSFNQQINSVTPHIFDVSFLLSICRSTYFSSTAWSKSSSTTIAILNKGNWENILIPVPPLAEQIRIVAKVDELMALCDQLETEQANSADAHEKLVSILLDALTQGDNFTESWVRLQEHFDVLFTTPASIDKLKQTLLQLAVMGELLPQDPNDEPASELLKKIRKEKDKLVADGKIKKDKPLPPIADEEKPFDLPNGWEWVRFCDYAIDIATGPFGSMIHQTDYVKDGIPLINPCHMINDQIFPDTNISVSQKMAKSLESYLLLEGDIVMARRGEVGRIALVTEKESGWLCGTGSFILRFGSLIFRDYLKMIFRCESIRKYLVGEAVGMTMVNLNHGILKKMPFALPPQSEQLRIVAKVDDLMAQCDQLKAKLVESGKQQRKLADVMVERAIVESWNSPNEIVSALSCD